MRSTTRTQAHRAVRFHARTAPTTRSNNTSVSQPKYALLVLATIALVGLLLAVLLVCVRRHRHRQGQRRRVVAARWLDGDGGGGRGLKESECGYGYGLALDTGTETGDGHGYLVSGGHRWTGLGSGLAWAWVREMVEGIVGAVQALGRGVSMASAREKLVAPPGDVEFGAAADDACGFGYGYGYGYDYGVGGRMGGQADGCEAADREAAVPMGSVEWLKRWSVLVAGPGPETCLVRRRGVGKMSAGGECPA